MARIPAGVIERLKSEIAIERLAEARGVVFERRGADLHGRCPFHEDKTPSLVVTPSKNLWHCLGACQAGGTVIDWVMRVEGVSFRHAVELLLNDSLPLAAAAPASCTAETQHRAQAPGIARAQHGGCQAPDAGDRLLPRDTARRVPRRSSTSRAAASARRKPSRPSAWATPIARSAIGCRRGLGSRALRSADSCRRIGLWRESGHEHFNGSIVIPVIAPSGEVTEVYGRKITHGLRPGTPLHLYLPGPHRGVWNAAALTTPEVILCEALIDALTFWCAGYRNVTASYGVEGFTADHRSLFKQCGAQRVLIAYDRDEAGDRAAEKLAGELMAQGLDCYRVLFPKGHGCERVRAQSHAGREESRRCDPLGAVDGQGQAETAPGGERGGRRCRMSCVIPRPWLPL